MNNLAGSEQPEKLKRQRETNMKKIDREEKRREEEHLLSLVRLGRPAASGWKGRVQCRAVRSHPLLRPSLSFLYQSWRGKGKVGVGV